MLPIRYPEASHAHPWPTGEDILDPAEPPVRVWIPDAPLLVLGNSQAAEVELHVDAAEADGVPVYQRKGGGGAVYLDAHCVCVALRLRRDKTLAIADYFAAGNGLIQAAFFAGFGIRAGLRGISDLAWLEERHGQWEERKLSGSSLHLPRECGVYLASILVDADLGALDRYLRHPSREPEYLQGRGHADFVANLSALARGATPQGLKQALEAEAARPEFQRLLAPRRA
jgi:lipoate-protein ligase A